ncbi:MAG: class I tRNA ligase family protein, partial [Deltaproteobacteria bacterium]|nr:class I tRNA ligase family protein [Deltaproteobacteria bacterium]
WPISRQLWWGHQIPVWSKKLTRGELADASAALLKTLSGPKTENAATENAVARVVRKEDGLSFPLTEGLSSLPEVDDEASLLKAVEARGYERDPDVLDTWFSSALWPHSTLGWPHPATADTEGGASMGAGEAGMDCLQAYYPGSCLVTARDIITLWVARMVLSGLYNLGDIPFTDVFIHANILDGKGERMSKSKGNGIDPVDIIETYGTDAMRYVLCDMQTGNQDIRLPVTAICPACEHHNDLAAIKHGKTKFTFLCAECQAEFDVLGTMPDVPAAKLISERFVDGRKFCNKLWNTARFALGHLAEVPHEKLTIDDLQVEDRWILAALNRAIRAVDRGLSDYNPSAALGSARDFMWGELCDWYLELVKPRLTGDDPKSAAVAQQVLALALDQTLRLLQPFVPFITEYLYDRLCEQAPQRGLPGLWDGDEAKLLIKAPWPRPEEALDDPGLLATFANLQATTSGIRDARASKGMSPAQALKVTLRPPVEQADEIRAQAHVVQHLANVSELIVDPEATAPKGSASRVVGQLQIFIHDMVDPTEEKDRLETELARVAKEVNICEKKLSNERFTAKAPATVVDAQRQRLEKYQAQHEAINRALAELEAEA